MQRIVNVIVFHALTLGSLLGLCALALAAYVTHGPALLLAPHDNANVMTALHYQLMHAILLICLGLTQRPSRAPSKIIGLAVLFIAIGVLFFCGGIYGAYLALLPGLLIFVPAGGISLMLGWLLLIVVGLRQANAEQKR